MKTVNLLTIATFLVGLCCLSGCKTTTTQAFYTYETECLGVGMDGTQTLKAWGSGKNKTEAKAQAMKNAVSDVLFKGIHSGKKECGIRPVLLEVNVREKNEDYFNAFFQENGPYMQYVTDETPKFTTKEKEYTQSQTKMGVVVKVQRAELKKRMEQDGIIKK